MDEPKPRARAARRGASPNPAPAFDPLRFVAQTPAKSRSAAIAELAYFRALDRGFEAGHEVADWLAAEAEFDERHGTHN